MHFNAQERELMLAGAKIGGKYYNDYTGDSLRKSEIQRMQTAIDTGHDVTGAALRMVCLGLEIMFWRIDSAPEGIPALLNRLEPICGYERWGMDLQSIAGVGWGGF